MHEHIGAIRRPRELPITGGARSDQEGIIALEVYIMNKLA